MKTIPVFRGIIKGSLKLEKPDVFKQYISSLEGYMVSVIVEKIIGKRSLNQNSLYWAYLTIISDEGSNPPEELHEVFKNEFLGNKREVVEAFGKTAVKQPSTATLDKQEFADYMASIEELTGVPVPNPEELIVKS